MLVVLELSDYLWAKVIFKEGNSLSAYKRNQNKPPSKRAKYQFTALNMTVNNNTTINNNKCKVGPNSDLSSEDEVEQDEEEDDEDND